MRSRSYRHRSRIRKESRTIPLYGSPERGNGLDDGRYFRCWNCGFICNIDRDALGGPESRDGLSYEDFPVPVYGAQGGVDYSNIARLGGSIGNETLVCIREEDDFPGDYFYPSEPDTLKTEYYARRHPTENAGFLNRRPQMLGVSIMITMALWNPANVVKDRYEIKPIVNSGCPMCGTLNWKGDY